MHKTIIIFKGEKSGRAAFCEHVQRTVVPKLLEATPQSLKMTITVESPPALSVIPFSKTPVACVSLVGNDDFFNTVEDDPFLSSAHRVDEALPVSYEIDWKNGEVTPGVCLLTLFNPLVFFGGPAKCLWNMIVTLKDVRSFIDYSSIETYLAKSTG